MNPQEDLREIEEFVEDLAHNYHCESCNFPNYNFNEGVCNCDEIIIDKIKQIAERNKFEGGCGKRLIEDDDGDRCWFVDCGEYSFLLGEIIFCSDCQAKKKIQEITKEVIDD